MSKIAIICVDDESVVLQGLSSQLGRHFGKDYLIELAQSGEEALEVIQDLTGENYDIPVMVTDQIMPGLKGSELLKVVREISPSTLSILLTGQAGVDDIGEALNHGNLYRYMAKPWEGSDLILSIQEALKSFEKDRKLDEQNQRLVEYNEQLEEMVALRTNELEAEKEKTDRLLRNILPAQVAHELKETGYTTPARFEEVTVLFSDFKEFTNIVATIPTNKLVRELNDIFSQFDDIMEAEGVEKIQTVGDAYLAVGGLPIEVPDHAIKCTKAALKMIQYLQDRNESNAIKWNVRIGLHSGPITAGVVGKKKFAYNIFGDTINTAARIETAGEAGRINVSAYTYDLIKDQFPCEYRGKIDAKGKGHLDMYFVNHPEPESKPEGGLDDQ